MTATAHALVGGAIAYAVPNPVIGISLAFISHPLLDMIPHWDAGWGWRSKTKKRLFTEAVIDCILGLGLAFLLFGGTTPFWYLLACIFASEALDLMEIPYWFFRWDFPPFSWIYKFQHNIQGKAKLPWGVLTQVVTVGLIIFLLTSVSVKFWSNFLDVVFKLTVHIWMLEG